MGTRRGFASEGPGDANTFLAKEFLPAAVAASADAVWNRDDASSAAENQHSHRTRIREQEARLNPNEPRNGVDLLGGAKPHLFWGRRESKGWAVVDAREPQRPTALISYSHDSPEHEQRVLELCNRLRARGIDALRRSVPARRAERRLAAVDGAPDREPRLHADGVHRSVPPPLHGGRGGRRRARRRVGSAHPAQPLVRGLGDGTAGSFRCCSIPMPARSSRRSSAVTSTTSATSADSRACCVTCCASPEPRPARSDRSVRRAAAGARSSGRGLCPTRCARAISPAASICSRCLRQQLVERGRAALSGLGGVGKTQSAHRVRGAASRRLSRRRLLGQRRDSRTT